LIIPRNPPDLGRIVRAFEDLPHARSLGMTFLSLDHGRGTMRIAYDPALVGNPRTRVVHGGVITALLDTVCGAVVMASVPEGTPLVTLDLRIDYLHPATPEETIRASAECYKVTANVAFVRGLAYHEAIDDPIAHCAGTFMLGTGFSAMTAERDAGDEGAGVGGQPL
jgi:uncharacterized protein (TIGR00369 family)